MTPAVFGNQLEELQRNIREYQEMFHSKSPAVYEDVYGENYDGPTDTYAIAYDEIQNIDQTNEELGEAFSYEEEAFLKKHVLKVVETTLRQKEQKNQRKMTIIMKTIVFVN